jgi:ATP-dependent Clp protease adaptor protein ClpS
VIANDPLLAVPSPASPEVESIEQEEVDEAVDTPWRVILFNDDHHAFDAVIAQVQKATRCSAGEAFQITYTAHHNGQAVAYVGGKVDCEQVAAVLREIDLRVELEAA